MGSYNELIKRQNELYTALTEFNITQSFNNLLNVIEKLRTLASRIIKTEENTIFNHYYKYAQTVVIGEFECVSIDTILDYSIKLCERT